ncbi:MAG: hypothetical protein ACLSHC_13285 [Bilophila wadsworthia]
MNVTKYLDSSSPNICKALSANPGFRGAHLLPYGQRRAIKFRNHDGERGGGLLHLRGGGDLPYEEIALNYATIK